MRSLTPFPLLVALAVAGCGGDEPETADTDASQRPVPQRPAVDTTLGDTVALGPDSTGQGESRPGQPSGGPGQGGAPSGQAAGQRSAGPDSGGGGAAGRGADRERLYTVQVAAFENAQSATEWVGRLRSQGFPVWSSLAEVRGRTFHRVRVGAVPSVSEARRLGAMITRRFEWPVWIAPLTPADPVPESAVEDTRRAIAGG